MDNGSALKGHQQVAGKVGTQRERSSVIDYSCLPEALDGE